MTMELRSEELTNHFKQTRDIINRAKSGHKSYHNHNTKDGINQIK